MDIDVSVEGEHICLIALLHEKAPNLCRQLMDALPVRGRITHAKLSGSVLFFTLPFIAPWENFFLFEEVPSQRKEGTNRGAVCVNNASQHLCIAYNQQVISEPLGMSYIGDVVEGLDKLENVGLRSWLRQGYKIQLTAH